MLRALDLFCGACGGWSVGLHNNGIETVAACEIDPWRRETFASNFPKARMYDDVRSLTADRLRNDLGYLPDVIVGSPPCQDASTANAKGKGVDGERTGLFFDAVRLVREVRPDWCIFENVPGLRARGYDRVHDALEEAGYTVRPLVVGAWHAGAPHRRNRVWIVAFPQSLRNAQPHRLERDERGRLGDVCEQRVQANDVAEPTSEQVGRARQSRSEAAREDAPDTSRTDAAGRGADLRRDGRAELLERSGGILADWQDWNGGPPDLGRVDAGLPKGMARKMLSAYGDTVVPKVTTAIIRAVLTSLPPAHASAA